MRVGAFAAAQHGVVTWRQLIASGVSKAAIEHDLRVGRLHRLHRGVYAVGFLPRSPLAEAMAAVLACGPGAVLSHRSAAALWGFATDWPSLIEVTTPTHRKSRCLRIHQSRTLAPSDTTSYREIPVTTPPRTLLDLTDVLSNSSLARAINEAQVQKRATRRELEAQLARANGRHAASRLRPFVALDDAPTRSMLEDEFLRFLAARDLPRPEANQRVGRYEVDMLWRPANVVVELDGYAFHQGRFEADRARDAELTAAGMRVIRITWARLHERPDREERLLRRVLSSG